MLNASRHHSDDDPGAGAVKKSPGRCSTPRGITATTTSVSARPLTSPVPCSTPRGITATTTTSASGRRCCGDAVLNASRHHSDDDGERDREFARVERVLNASRHHSDDDPRRTHSRHPRRDSAQRLAASQRRRPVRERRLRPVHPCSTPRGITATTTARTRRPGPVGRFVLNASRHHSDDDEIGEARGELCLRVLNASRHHSDDDLPTFTTGMRRLFTCSTPRGITATTTAPLATSGNSTPSDGCFHAPGERARTPFDPRLGNGSVALGIKLTSLVHASPGCQRAGDLLRSRR